MRRQCPFCGTELPGFARFCSQCGRKVCRQGRRGWILFVLLAALFALLFLSRARTSTRRDYFHERREPVRRLWRDGACFRGSVDPATIAGPRLLRE
ncbi:MAG: zinc-ribbon domain-containing protein [Bacillota bacterium]